MCIHVRWIIIEKDYLLSEKFKYCSVGKVKDVKLSYLICHNLQIYVVFNRMQGWLYEWNGYDRLNVFWVI